eukprot:CAMPEP_0194151866 /NCGR_PEP_ID=MMETSP0152-20130528/49795_1 /TAXON_ID=1049557 /ORGANISM="Thalassiothrix antarctica, Strain L6-D1" /LENGTH=319 /DNA_ID=CAMNT_0038855961 /DNA_START=146 /DNA_END=1105 /DNA_ORIENTATION=+
MINDKDSIASIDTTTKEERLLSWALLLSDDEHNVSIGPSTISSNNSGNGLFATKSISKDEIIMIIPYERILDIENAWEASDLGDAFCYLCDMGGSGAKLATLAGYIAKETRGGISNIFHPNNNDDEVSYWKPYLDCLPSKSAKENHILWWSNDKVERLLRGSNIYDEVMELRSQVTIAIENNQILFWNYYNNEETKEKDLNKTLVDKTIEELVRSAYCMILSRSFEDDEVDCMKLVPILDMAQHSRDTNIRHETIPSTGNVVVTAKRHISKGEELFNCYSTTMKPHNFLTVFGFVPNNNNESAEELLERKDPIFFSEDD